MLTASPLGISDSYDGYSELKPVKFISPGVLFCLLVASIEQVGEYYLDLIVNDSETDDVYKPLRDSVITPPFLSSLFKAVVTTFLVTN